MYRNIQEIIRHKICNVVNQIKRTTRTDMKKLLYYSGNYVGIVVRMRQKWYECKLDKVKGNDVAMILWDFNIQTDRELSARKPVIVLIR